ncbi:hypothetical protein A6R68_09510 [Neotoma lepida]|uniref:Uncharacterized protein n=1 Tax=Neotoma lepida TaxID=56216 RepID=A0A1A6G1U7_NEOLE|nr:hypothetical protein A6R68_09510 [Neotoma lepida]
MNVVAGGYLPEKLVEISLVKIFQRHLIMPTATCWCPELTSCLTQHLVEVCHMLLVVPQTASICSSPSWNSSPSLIMS